MSVSSLQVLADNREKLLLAEVGALVHNIGKLSEEFLKYQAGETKFGHYDYQAIVGIVSQLIPTTLTSQERQRLQSALDANQEAVTSALLSADHKNWLMNRVLDLPVPLNDHKYALGDFIEFQDFGWYKPTKGGSPPRVVLLFPSGSRGTELLEASHNAASGVEKEGVPKDDGKQTKFPLYLATAFGLETPIQENNLKTWRNELLDALRLNGRSISKLTNLEKAVGDTRRPINEVLLSNLSFSVAALFKSALAQVIVTRKWISRDNLRWRLLRVNFDVLALYAKAIKIPDLLGYQRAVEEACERVKKLVEEEYPLGNEIYRDTTGIYFTFPDLDLPADLEQEIRRRVEDVEPELAPHIAVKKGENDATAQEQIKSILGKARDEAFQARPHPFSPQNLSQIWQQEWEKVQREPDKKWEVCPMCGLRPKEESAEVCEHCAKRRAPRLESWLKNPSQTIWIGEIADHNDRIALLVGKFGLEDWLTGDLVQTMLVRAEPNNPNGCVSKNSSPARLRRVWETCQTFWQDTVLKEISSQLNKRQRKYLIPDKADWKHGLYNGKVNEKPLDLYWQPEHNAFLTVSNLDAAGELKLGDTVTLKWPDKNATAGTFTIQKIADADETFRQYQPWLSLLTTPDQFLVFVPAANALQIAKKIYDEYQTQFSKVRNRLPLFLGVVYFERKMPLMAVLDAARAMLNAPLRSELWIVNSADGAGHVEFENGIAWNVSTVMGDGKTEDLWYPYFALEGTPQSQRKYQFQHNGKTWVYVKDLRQGDTVSVTPSRFDFLWLDTASRRFALAYDESGRRFDRPSRPFYLEDLDRLDELWETFSKLTTTQIYQTLQTIETRRERWFGRDDARKSAQDPTFKQFVCDTFANAQWNWKDISEGQRKQFISAAVRGELADLAELHLSIFKEKPEEKE